MSNRRTFCQMSIPVTFPGSVGGISFSSNGTAGNQGFTYNDSPYVHALNRALQLEHAAVAIYAAKQRQGYQAASPSLSDALNRTELHHSALRQLVRLIFAQRGLPDSDPAGLTAVTGTVAARVSRYMPPIVQDPMLGVSAQRIEIALTRRYRQILTLAPSNDQHLITSLLDQAREFSGHL